MNIPYAMLDVNVCCYQWRWQSCGLVYGDDYELQFYHLHFLCQGQDSASCNSSRAQYLTCLEVLHHANSLCSKRVGMVYQLWLPRKHTVTSFLRYCSYKIKYLIGEEKGKGGIEMGKGSSHTCNYFSHFDSCHSLGLSLWLKRMPESSDW